MKRKTITVNDKMQTGYRYEPAARPGRNFDSEFKPDLAPKQMLKMGIFGGVYMRDCGNEFPKNWFVHARFQKTGSYEHDPKLNYFGVNASQSLAVWRKKGWIHPVDPRGWFQWYCRYYLGRRIADEDMRQIKRWKAMRRHIFQIKKHCVPGDLDCRRVQRQALLHWAYDSRKI